MLTAILLIFIGAWITAPTWYFVICGAILLGKLLSFAVDMYKAGSDK